LGNEKPSDHQNQSLSFFFSAMRMNSTAQASPF